MERRRDAGVREVMIPHLEATMGMDWTSPPPQVARLLDRQGVRPGNQISGPPDPQCGTLVERCGSLAVAEVAAQLGLARPLSWADIVRIQGTVLGRDACFRRGDAMTTIRSERYSILDGLEALIARKVEVDASDRAHDALKGIRLYLDLAFVHPFEDGNARAALLWLAYFYWRSGWPLPRLAHLPAFDFLPGDPACYWAFARVALSPCAKGPTTSSLGTATPSPS